MIVCGSVRLPAQPRSEIWFLCTAPCSSHSCIPALYTTLASYPCIPSLDPKPLPLSEMEERIRGQIHEKLVDLKN